MSLQVDVRKLELFNRIAKVGSQRVADSLSQMAHVDAAIELSKINLLHMDDVRDHLGEDKRIGIFLELTDPPEGYVLFTLPPAAGKRLARKMLPGQESPSKGFSDMEKSAIQEIGNVMTSGYIDGWANVLETTIDMSTPRMVYGSGPAIIQEMGGWPNRELVFILDSKIVATDTKVDLTVYTFPELEPLVELIQAIDLDTDIYADTEAPEQFTNN